MENLNYALFVNPEKFYPVSYTFDNRGNKIEGKSELRGKNMSENQIKEYLEINPKIKQAISEHNFDTCPNCKHLVPVELTYYNPDEDTEPSLIACLICYEGIRII